MKKIALILTLLISFNPSKAQSGDEVGWIAKFGAAGGFSPVYMFPDLGELNKFMPGFGVPEFSNGMFGFGGGGYAYIMFLENVRIGGVGFGGSMHKDAYTGGLYKEAEYTVGFGGFTIEYTLPFIKGFAVSLGAIIGGGELEVNLYQNSGPTNWNSIWTEFNGASSNTSRRMVYSFFSLSPTVNIDVPVNRFIALRFGGGYNWSASGEWKIDNDQNLAGVPDSFNSDSFFVQTGVYFGFFAF